MKEWQGALSLHFAQLSLASFIRGRSLLSSLSMPWQRRRMYETTQKRGMVLPVKVAIGKLQTVASAVGGGRGLTSTMIRVLELK